MKLLTFVIVAFAIQASAQLPQHWTPWPPNGTNYAIESACPKPCYPFVVKGVMLDLEVSDLIKGQILENTEKKAAKALRLSALQDAAAKAQADAQQKIDRMKALADKAQSGSITDEEKAEAIKMLLQQVK